MKSARVTWSVVVSLLVFTLANVPVTAQKNPTGPNRPSRAAL